jgi:hypothetical protein
MQCHKTHVQANHSRSISVATASPPTVSISANDNPFLLPFPITIPIHPRIPLHHSLRALNRNLLTRPIHTRNITISALTHSMLTRVSILVVLRINRANFSTRAIDREVRPCHQIAIGGFAPRTVGICLILMSVRCGVVELVWMIGCGVCVVCDVCGHAGRPWIVDLGFCLGGGVSLGGLGRRHG